jgi:phage tail-like protein
MDANRQRAHLLAQARHFVLAGDPPTLTWDLDRRVLRLASGRPTPALVEDEGAARTAVGRVPVAMDAFGTRARWDLDLGQIRATGARADEVTIASLSAADVVTDLALGEDDVLYVATSGRVRYVDLRGRFPDVLVEADGFRAAKLAAAPGGGVWALDRDGARLGRVRGLPLRPRPGFAYAPDVFRPDPEDPDPPRLELRVDGVMPTPGPGQPNETVVALAAHGEGQIAVLCWRRGADAIVRRRAPGGSWGATLLPGVRFPTALTFLTPARVAVLVPGQGEALAYDLVDGVASARLAGDRYPLRAPSDGGPFVQGAGGLPLYQVGPTVAPLVRVSRPSYPLQGETHAADLIDGGSAHAIWHRLYVEAVIPEGCALVVRLAATDDPQRPGPEAFHAHLFGRAAEPPSGVAGVPRAAWTRAPSEIPFHPGLLGCPPVPDRCGLFTVLIQRAGLKVRTLRGRYLWVNVELHGDGRTTPEVAALRAYASRFSYVENYLPELYRETVFGPPGDLVGTATPADFLERFVDLFEGVLTPLEDRIGAAYLLTDPAATPPERLGWLAGWLGLSFDPALSVERRRKMLASAAALYEKRGTRAGLELALDLATGGAVTRGEVVVLEDHRLRRTFATILGADLSDAGDPMLPGLAVSGNSFVGDTLLLGDEDRKEFLALFRAGIERDADEAAAVAALFDNLAYRATVLVHDEVSPQDLGLIQRVVDREAPAHVLTRVLTSSTRFLVGMAALVGVDTFLGPREPSRTSTVDRSQIGVRDRLQRVPALDPRVDASLVVERPMAVLDGPARALAGAPIQLDGRRSRAADAHSLARFLWTLIR